MSTENANKKILIIDMRNDEKIKVDANALQKLCKEIRNSDVTKYISRTIIAIHDPDCSSIITIPQNDIRKYLLVEVFGDNLDLNTKYVKAFLTSHKYKIVGSKVFKNKEYPVCKLIVKFQ